VVHGHSSGAAQYTLGDAAYHDGRRDGAIDSDGAIDAGYDLDGVYR